MNKKIEISTYDAKDIEVLEGLEPVRKRPGMYIGGTDSKALNHLGTEIIDNAIDEAIAGYASKISIELINERYLVVKDDGRGIPVDEHPKFPGKSALEVIVGTLHSGGKFESGAYKTSGGLHGVGISVVNALSEFLKIQVVRNKKLYQQTFSRGLPQSALKEIGPCGKNKGTSVFFKPDPEIFDNTLGFSPETLFSEAQSKAYLLSGLEISWICPDRLLDEKSQKFGSTKFIFPNGLRDFLGSKLKNQEPLSNNIFNERFIFKSKNSESNLGSFEWAAIWTNSSEPFLKSFCNLIQTPEGGTHVGGFWLAILKGIKSYGEMTGNKKVAQITKDDISANLCGVISVFFATPTFSGQTKEKLTSPEVSKLVENGLKSSFENWLTNDPKLANEILEILLKTSEERIKRRNEKDTLRKSFVKKLRLPGKLADCTSTVRRDTELFIVEGDSAGGSAKQARDRTFQAILPLRGKILNVVSASREKMLQNQEIIDLYKCLGASASDSYEADTLRYEKIIIMTDADVDGAHIASLLITFFFTQMRDLVEKGHLFIAVPPLYRISSGNQTIYASTEDEKAFVLENVLSGEKKVEVSRFKGLGEMNPKQLKDTTMDPSKRKLIRVSAEPSANSNNNSMVSDLMGKNADPRFQFIVSNAKFFDSSVV